MFSLSASAQQREGPGGLRVEDVAASTTLQVVWSGDDTVVRLRLYKRADKAVYRGGFVIRESELMAPLTGVRDGEEIVFAVPAEFSAPFEEVRVRVSTRSVHALAVWGERRWMVPAVRLNQEVRSGELYRVVLDEHVTY